MADEEKDAVDLALEVKDPEEELEKGEEKPSTSDDKPTLEDQLTETQTKLSDLQKSFTGQFSALKEERGKRQNLQGRLEEISSTLKDIQAAKAEVKEEPDANLSIPVEIDEEGTATISQKVIDDLVAERLKLLEDKVGKVEAATTESDNRTRQEKETSKIIDNIVAENETFPKAHNALNGAVKWLDERLIPKLEEDGFKTTPPTGTILDVLDGTEIESEFEKQFPGVSLDVIVRAHDSKRDLRAALKHLSPEEEKAEEKDDKTDMKTLASLAKKPSNLTGETNQKETRGLTLDMIASIDTEDMLEMSDDEIAKLLRVAEREELDQ